MKKLYSLLLCCICFYAYGSNKTFDRLAEVNKCWKEQKDVSPDLLPPYTTTSEREWIRTHLSLVEVILRKRSTTSLTKTQKQNRAHCLDLLHSYWQAGNFPINEDYAYRTPIFIDKHDNFCAVGYLVKATGNEQVSRMIASKTNLAYVREMNYPELDKWAAENGFTEDELALIQPGYAPDFYCYSQNIGGGVDGMVNELFVDNATGRMYVGGKFVQVDNEIAANNIAYVTESGGVYTWHDMGAGLNGPVYAIAKFDDKIFVGGSFDTAGGVPVNNIAYYDGTWHDIGCINGTVYDIAAFDGVLFAVGDFDSCSTGDEVNFAKLISGVWEPIPGLSGHLNTMEIMGTSLIIGGDFHHDTTTVNAIRWNEMESFQPFATNISNEVMDFEIYEDSLYAACKQTHPTDTNTLFLILRGTTWASPQSYRFDLDDFRDSSNVLSFNTLCSEPASLNIGGQFIYQTPIIPPFYLSPYSKNCFSFGNYAQSVDSAVNKMIVFNNELIIGGKFKTGYAAGGTIALNGIAKRKIVPASAPTVTTENRAFTTYPNPISTGSTLTIENNFSASRYTLHHITGRQFATGTINKTSTITLPDIPLGMYIITLINETGDRAMQKIVVE